MTEEQITKKIINYLEENGWTMICYDFPQSGTGHSLHLNKSLRTTKNKGVIIPDIVAIKKGKIVFFENKDRFVYSDFIKLKTIKWEGNYSESIGRLLTNYRYNKIYYGVGLPFTINNLKKAIDNKDCIDFELFVNEDSSIIIGYEIEQIFN